MLSKTSAGNTKIVVYARVGVYTKQIDNQEHAHGKQPNSRPRSFLRSTTKRRPIHNSARTRTLPLARSSRRHLARLYPAIQPGSLPDAGANGYRKYWDRYYFWQT